ncbi:MAG: hypothetical protein IIB23_00145 [Chloroflexi bacterium]|nr:hypothetical protein [Chloroflexota bacterium]MCH8064403.1 hypothetical protein [Chloroflexota bacterium]
MNTGKQVNAMVVVLLLTVIMIGVYTLFDPFRADTAEDDQLEMSAVRAATTFALNCRLCHGDRGEGGANGGRLPAAPALDRVGLRGIEKGLFSAAAFDEAFTLITNTVACGRAGTFMPTWGRSQGGTLTDEQIRQLAVLITGGNLGADPLHQGGFWDLAQEHADELDAEAMEHATLQMPSGDLDATATQIVVSNAGPFSPEQFIRIDDERMLVVDVPTTGRALVDDIGREPRQLLVSSAEGLAIGDIIRLDSELLEVTAIRNDADAGITLDQDATLFANRISVNNAAFFSEGYVLRAGGELIEVMGPVDTEQTLAVAFGRANTTIFVSGSAGIEQGMVIRMGEELLRVISVEPARVSINRGAEDADGNATQPASHAAGAAILKLVEEPAEGEEPEDPDTGQTLLATLDSNETTLTVSGVTGLSVGSTFQIGDELVEVKNVEPAVLRVERGVGGTSNDFHSRRVRIFIGNLLEVERGVQGTSAAAQTAGTPALFTELDVERAVGGSTVADHTKNSEVFIGSSFFVERGVLGTEAAGHANDTLVLDFPVAPDNPSTNKGPTCGQLPVDLGDGPSPDVTPDPNATQVAISLSEFNVVPDAASISSGLTNFTVANDGAIPHNFRLIATDLAPDALPVVGSAVDEEGLTVVAEIGLFGPGDSRLTPATQLDAGSYVLICNVAGHYESGMFAGFEVVGP